MTTATTETPVVVALSLKDLKEQSKAFKASQDKLKEQMAGIRTSKKEEETKEIKALIEDLSSMGKLTFIVEENGTIHELTLEEALVTGKPTTIQAKDSKTGEMKDRAHTLFLDSARILSLQKAMKRVKLIASNEEIRPKSLKPLEAAKVENPEVTKDETTDETKVDVPEATSEVVKPSKGKKNKGDVIA